MQKNSLASFISNNKLLKKRKPSESLFNMLSNLSPERNYETFSLRSYSNNFKQSQGRIANLTHLNSEADADSIKDSIW